MNLQRIEPAAKSLAESPNGLTPHLESVGLGDERLTFHDLRKALNKFFIREKAPSGDRCKFTGHEIAHINASVESEPYKRQDLAALVELSQISLLDLTPF